VLDSARPHSYRGRGARSARTQPETRRDATLVLVFTAIPSAHRRRRVRLENVFFFGSKAKTKNGRREFLPAVQVIAVSCLSVSSARATTVEPASHAAVSAALVEPSACATAETISVETTALNAVPSAKTVFPAYEAVSVIARASIESRTAVETRPPIAAADPQTRSDQNA